MASLAVAYSLNKKRKKMAEGGKVKPAPSPSPAPNIVDADKAKDFRKSFSSAFAKGGKVVDEKAEGGAVGCPSCGYSEGGKIANQEHGENNNELAGFSPNEFDDLVLRDDLESDSDGANNGDELGNEQEDSDRKDIVSKIMASRKKKDKNPRPA